MLKKATFGAGCFWGVEAAFRQLSSGVKATRVGYAGGDLPNPSYEQVCTGRTGHAEVVEVEYEDSEISYPDLLEVFWNEHDPTQLNRQGPDVGHQYRSAIFTEGDEQKFQAVESLAKRQASRIHRRPIVTTIEDAGTFHEAEDYHQQYLEKRGLSPCRIPSSA